MDGYLQRAISCSWHSPPIGTPEVMRGLDRGLKVGRGHLAEFGLRRHGESHSRDTSSLQSRTLEKSASGVCTRWLRCSPHHRSMTMALQRCELRVSRAQASDMSLRKTRTVSYQTRLACGLQGFHLRQPCSWDSGHTDWLHGPSGLQSQGWSKSKRHA